MNSFNENIEKLSNNISEALSNHKFLISMGLSIKNMAFQTILSINHINEYVIFVNFRKNIEGFSDIALNTLIPNENEMCELLLVSKYDIILRNYLINRKTILILKDILEKRKSKPSIVKIINTLLNSTISFQEVVQIFKRIGTEIPDYLNTEEIRPLYKLTFNKLVAMIKKEGLSIKDLRSYILSLNDILTMKTFTYDRERLVNLIISLINVQHPIRKQNEEIELFDEDDIKKNIENECYLDMEYQSFEPFIL